jgi:Domain of unknown function (DUF3786)
MAGLTERAGGGDFKGEGAVERAHQAWEESMTRQLDSLREEVRSKDPGLLALRCGGYFEHGEMCLKYWGEEVTIAWPELEARFTDKDKRCSIFDTAMLLYYLRSADGAPMADQWVSYRELPGGGFYHLAFQGYSGDRIAQAYGEDPQAFDQAARAQGGWRLGGLAAHAYSFEALPRIRLAAILWPGDEEFPSRAAVLFDAAAEHYMTIDGLALLGAGLARRLEKKR